MACIILENYSYTSSRLRLLRSSAYSFRFIVTPAFILWNLVRECSEIRTPQSGGREIDTEEINFGSTSIASIMPSASEIKIRMKQSHLFSNVSLP